MGVVITVAGKIFNKKALVETRAEL